MPSLRLGSPSQEPCPFRVRREGSPFPQRLWITPLFPVDNIPDLGITGGLHNDREPITTSNRHPVPLSVHPVHTFSTNC